MAFKIKLRKPGNVGKAEFFMWLILSAVWVVAVIALSLTGWVYVGVLTVYFVLYFVSTWTGGFGLAKWLDKRDARKAAQQA